MNLTLKIDAALLILVALVSVSVIFYVGADSEIDGGIYMVVAAICSILSTVVITIDHRLGLLEKAVNAKNAEPNAGRGE